MKKEYFIGIVPPERYMERIVNFQRKCRMKFAVEPHITLKAQGGLSQDEKWINKVIKVCGNYKTFQISLDKPEFFGDNILYLSVISDDLYVLHQKIVREISPSEELIKQYFELEDYVPHLTLGKEQYGLKKEDLKDMEKLAEKELTPYPIFKVDFIRVYELNTEAQRYEKYIDIPLEKE
ncbi:2'-5' RNA ligase family protein [Rossellomorea aquimaris]|uniref:2'-5' RNA ligase family protein n=1 Tax=Rossellomorea aquimaris TaxID=189382 RepID=UPI0007D0B7E8|nr:2'-5' RNA ligase family protein [Rossellomorea aquimaris]